MPDSTNKSSSKHTPLKKGDLVGLITPAGPINEDRLKRAVDNMESLGLKVLHTQAVLQKDGYLAGKDATRLDELHDMYRNSEVNAIWCIRGGYGTTRILDQIDFKLIKANPKPLIGYSDITALLNSIHQKTSSPCYHAPVASSNMTPYTLKNLQPLFGLQNPWTISLADSNQKRGMNEEIYQFNVIHPGIVKAKIVGGNLSLINAVIGTKHCIKTKNKIVFIEDVGEQPYRVDRMLSQLILANFFKNVAGVVFGVFAGCERKNENSWTLLQVIKERMSQIQKPCVYGFSFGHIDDQCTFPIGSEAKLDTYQKTITLMPS